MMKQDSHFYEYFYKDLKPYEHYIPFKRDLSDLNEKLQWAKDHDEEVGIVCTVTIINTNQLLNFPNYFRRVQMN